MVVDKSIIKFGSNRVWRTYQGGKILDLMEGKPSPMDSHYPEDWIGSITRAINPGRHDSDEGMSYISDGGGERISFKDLISSNPEYHCGKKNRRWMDALPLVKYLDSATRLHFQVHPTAKFAREHLNSNRGKTEAYVILAIREGIENPYIYAGFQRPPGRAQLRKWILEQNIPAIEACFTPIPVKPGDVFIIPGGRPHALGAGILMLEIMEASDLAVRFEFERNGFVIPEASRFMGRDIELALDVFNFDPVDESLIDSIFRCQPKTVEDHGSAGRFEELIGKSHTSCFSVRRSIVCGEIKKPVSEGFIGVVAEGNGEVRAGGRVTMLNQWDRFFCPAEAGIVHYASGRGMVVLESYSGNSR